MALDLILQDRLNLVQLTGLYWASWDKQHLIEVLVVCEIVKVWSDVKILHSLGILLLQLFYLC